MRNPVTLAQMKEKDFFSCDPIDRVPCPTPQVCRYNESIPGGERNMGSCIPCPAEYPWLENQRSVSTTPLFSPSIAAAKQPEIVAVMSSILTVLGAWIFYH
jgi:hypothetical protein